MPPSRSGSHADAHANSDATVLAGAPTSRAMARSFAVLNICGGLVALAWSLIPGQDDNGDHVIVAAIAILSLIGGTALLTGVIDHVPTWTFHLVIVFAQTMITVAYAAAATPGNDLRLAYIWSTPFASFFFRRRGAVLHLLLAGVLLAGALAVQGAELGAAVRLFTFTYGTVVAVGALVMWVAEAVRRREVQLQHAATHDPLTTLANRTLFARRAAEALERRHDHGGAVFVVLADLDRFKMVNDTHGHHVGDALLVALAPRIQAAAPEGSTVARMGGDEFAVLVEDPTGSLDPREVVGRIADAWHDPVVTVRGQLHTSACLGISVADDGDTPSSLLRDADAAMYRAKRQGPGSASVFDGAQRAVVQRRFAIEQALHTAIEHAQLSLAFHPIVDLAAGRTHAAEVLLRWHHPVLGEVPPNDFISLAEETGLIGPLGDWVAEQAVGQLAEWRRAALVGDGFCLSINVSNRQFNRDFVATVRRLLEEHDVPAENLMMELTESTLIDGTTVTNDVLGELTGIGIPLVLDDFGTGYSSLSYLQRARFDAVKVDRTFVAGVDANGTARTIVTGIVGLAAALYVDVIAEGVETEAQAAALSAMGCRFAQGYLYDHPLTAAEFAERLSAPPRRGEVPPSAPTPVAPTPSPPVADSHPTPAPPVADSHPTHEAHASAHQRHTDTSAGERMASIAAHRQ